MLSLLEPSWPSPRSRLACTSRSGSCCRSRWSCGRRWPCSTGSSSTSTWCPTLLTPPTRSTSRRPRPAARGRCGAAPSATPGAPPDALSGVSLGASPGHLVALVGPSGAGKTTISYLIPRLYDVTAGAVEVDGVDVRHARQASLAAAIGFVTQESYLFHDTVLANIRYGRPGASQEEVEEAARAAYIHDRIMEFSDRYDTFADERAARLSAGEKQRLAIACVLLLAPRILILDEATSALDTASE